MAYDVNNVSQRDFIACWTRKQKQEMCKNFQRQSLFSSGLSLPVGRPSEGSNATNDDLLAGGDNSDGVDEDGNKVSWLISFNVRSQ